MAKKEGKENQAEKQIYRQSLQSKKKKKNSENIDWKKRFSNASMTNTMFRKKMHLLQEWNEL